MANLPPNPPPLPLENGDDEREWTTGRAEIHREEWRTFLVLARQIAQFGMAAPAHIRTEYERLRRKLHIPDDELEARVFTQAVGIGGESTAARYYSALDPGERVAVIREEIGFWRDHTEARIEFLGAKLGEDIYETRELTRESRDHLQEEIRDLRRIGLIIVTFVGALLLFCVIVLSFLAAEILHLRSGMGYMGTFLQWLYRGEVRYGF